MSCQIRARTSLEGEQKTICWRDVVYEKAAFGWNYARCVALLARKRRTGRVRCVATLCKQDMTCLHYPVRKSRFSDWQSPSFILKCCIIPCLPIVRDVLPRDANRKAVENIFLCSPQHYHRYLQPCHYHLPADRHNTANSRYNAATRNMLTRPFARKSTIPPGNTPTPTAPTRGYSSQVQNTESTSPADKYAH